MHKYISGHCPTRGRELKCLVVGLLVVLGLEIVFAALELYFH